MESTRDFLVDSGAPKRSRALWVKPLGLALLLAAVYLVGKTCWTEETEAGASAFLQLWSEAECKGFGLDMVQTVHRNLGGFGPDHGEKSLVFSLSGAGGKEVEMVLVSLNPDFHPWHAQKMGTRHGLGIVDTVASSKLLVNVSFRSPKTKEAVTLPQLGISFYGLAKKHLSESHSKKIVKVFGDWTDAIRSEGSTVRESQNKEDRSITFRSTAVSRNGNPKGPLSLSQQQFSQAVSVRFRDVHSFKIQFETGEYDHHQFFGFAPQVALLCAKTSEGSRPAPSFIQNHRLTKHMEVHEGEIPVKEPRGGGTFKHWFAAVGDLVHEGDRLYSDTVGKKHLEVVRAPARGRVVKINSELMPGDAVEPGSRMVIIQTHTKVMWATLSILLGGAVCATVLMVGLCYKWLSEEPPAPVVIDEDDTLVIEFVDPSGWKQTGSWKYKPLGLGFHESWPPVVAYVSDEAKNTGILEGDELVKLGTVKQGLRRIETLIRTKSYDEFIKCLTTTVSRLPDAPSLVLEFETPNGTDRQLEWTTKPLGLSFEETMPMVVSKVHEEGMHMDVQTGYKLKGYRLGGNQLQSIDAMTYDEVWNAISEHMSSFPLATRMILQFELPDKSLREFMWHAKPLGVEFGAGDNPVVSKVSHPADKKGVKEGYVLKRFGNDYRMLEATKDQTHDQTMAVMQKFLKLLPDARQDLVTDW